MRRYCGDRAFQIPIVLSFLKKNTLLWLHAYFVERQSLESQADCRLMQRDAERHRRSPKVEEAFQPTDEQTCLFLPTQRRCVRLRKGGGTPAGEKSLEEQLQPNEDREIVPRQPFFMTLAAPETSSMQQAPSRSLGLAQSRIFKRRKKPRCGAQLGLISLKLFHVTLAPSECFIHSHVCLYTAQTLAPAPQQAPWAQVRSSAHKRSKSNFNYRSLISFMLENLYRSQEGQLGISQL